MVPPLGPKAWERLWSCIHITGPDECWVWIGPKQKTEPPRFSFVVGGKKYRITARKLLFQEVYGPVPDKARVYTVCSNSICLNPEHFFLAPPGFHTGDQMSGAFMSREKAQEMRWTKAKNPSFSYRKLGEMWEVSSGTAFKICKNEIWCTDKWPYRVSIPTTSATFTSSDEPQLNSKDGTNPNGT